MANRSDLRDLVIHRVGLTATDQRMTEDLLNKDISAGLQRFAAEMDWPWLEALTTFDSVAGQVAYDLPAFCSRVKSLTWNGSIMRYLQFSDLQRYLLVSNQWPTSYALLANQIYIGPTPTGVNTFTLVYVKPEIALTDDSTQILTPDWYTDVVVMYAAKVTALRLQDQTLAGSIDNDRIAWLRTVADSTERSTQAPAIRTREDF